MSPRRGDEDPLGRPPRWVALPAGLGALLVLLPLVGMVAAIEPTGLVARLTSPEALRALCLSLRTAAASTLLCLLLGVPLALLLARGRFPGRRLLRGLVLVPLVLPPVVGGLALLLTFGRRGLVGRHLEAVGVEVAFTTLAVVLAQTFVALPFLVLTVEGAVRGLGTELEAATATLGAGPTRRLLLVTLPLLRPAIVSGAVLAMARALGEFGATLTFAGSLGGVTRTLPIEIYLLRESDPAAALALSLLLVAAAVAVVAAVYGRADRAARR